MESKQKLKRSLPTSYEKRNERNHCTSCRFLNDPSKSNCVASSLLWKWKIKTRSKPNRHSSIIANHDLFIQQWIPCSPFGQTDVFQLCTLPNTKDGLPCGQPLQGKRRPLLAVRDQGVARRDCLTVSVDSTTQVTRGSFSLRQAASVNYCPFLIWGGNYMHSVLG